MILSEGVHQQQSSAPNQPRQTTLTNRHYSRGAVAQMMIVIITNGHWN